MRGKDFTFQAPREAPTELREKAQQITASKRKQAHKSKLELKKNWIPLWISGV